MTQQTIVAVDQWLAHIRTCRDCEAGWLADAPEQMCEHGERLVVRLDGVLEAELQ